MPLWVLVVPCRKDDRHVVAMPAVLVTWQECQEGTCDPHLSPWSAAAGMIVKRLGGFLSCICRQSPPMPDSVMLPQEPAGTSTRSFQALLTAAGGRFASEQASLEHWWLHV